MIQPSALAAFEDAAGAGDSHAIAEQLDIECGILGADAAVARLDREGAARSSDGHERLAARSEEHTSELQSLMRSPYAVFCLYKQTKYSIPIQYHSETLT